MTTPADGAAAAEPGTDSPATDNAGDAVSREENNVSTEAEPTPNSEAARWRVKLREAEAERDALAERLTGYQRRECEAAVADLLEMPEDLWEIGQADVATFYTDDGSLDEAQLRAAAGALCEMRPKLAKPRGPRWQDFGQGSKPPPSPGVGWGAVLQQ